MDREPAGFVPRRIDKTKQPLSKHSSKRQSASYEGALEAVLAIPIAMGIGWWCDGQFDSKPIGLGIGALVGFAAMLLRVLRMRPPEDDSEIASEPVSASDTTNDLANSFAIDFTRDDADDEPDNHSTNERDPNNPNR